MAGKSVLELTQDILSEMGSDQVSTISETSESDQVVKVLRSVFDMIVDEYDVPALEKRVQFNASGDLTKPTHMTPDVEVNKISVVRYDVRLLETDPIKYQKVPYVSPDTFLERTYTRVASDANTLTVVDGTSLVPTLRLLIRNDKQPEYWTSFDNSTMIFDSYLNTVDSTLQQSKIVVLAKERPQFLLEDAYVPELPEHLHSLLLAEAKSTCFVSVKEVTNVKTEQHAKRLRVRSQRSKNRIKLANELPYPDYGRRR